MLTHGTVIQNLKINEVYTRTRKTHGNIMKRKQIVVQFIKELDGID